MTAKLHVCVSCKGASGTGAQTRAALADLPISVEPQACLGPCGDGVRAALTAPGRWGWLFADLSASDRDALAAFIALWQASADGQVVKARRPPSLATRILGRIPPSDG